MRLQNWQLREALKCWDSAGLISLHEAISYPRVALGGNVDKAVPLSCFAMSKDQSGVAELLSGLKPQYELRSLDIAAKRDCVIHNTPRASRLAGADLNPELKEDI